MLKSPEVPSDNLYKFLAIFGLVVFIFSIYSLISTQNSFYTRIDKWSEEQDEKIFTESKNLSKELFLRDKIEMLRAKIKSKYSWEGEGFTNEKTATLLKVDSFEFDITQLKQLQLDLNLLNDENSHLKRITKKTALEIDNEYVYPIFILMIIGIILILSGFRLWYIKTQVHLDRELKKTINKF